VAEFHSDRVSGPVPRTSSALTVTTAKGLVSLVTSKIGQNWFAKEFPARCQDNDAIAGTDESSLMANMTALIPKLKLPLSLNDDDDVIFDLLEYTVERVAGVQTREWHSYWGHSHLAFDSDLGPAEFREDVNQILARGGIALTMNESCVIERLGSEEVRTAVARLPVKDTGDAELESLFGDARALYFSRDARDRRMALERMWDAFERLKTIQRPASKLAGINAILDLVEPPELRVVIDAEMQALTNFGNRFTIRHHEINKVPVPADASDYLVQRMSALVVFLLERIGRVDLT